MTALPRPWAETPAERRLRDIGDLTGVIHGSARRPVRVNLSIEHIFAIDMGREALALLRRRTALLDAEDFPGPMEFAEIDHEVRALLARAGGD